MTKQISRRVFLGVMGGGAAAVTLAGCSGGSSSSNSSSSNAVKTYKDTLKIAITANPPSLDPHYVNSNVVSGVSMHIYEPLFALNEKYEVTPVLAESYTKEGTDYIIKIRQGVKFHNGQELTADDVVASMIRWVNTSGKAKPLLGGSTFEKVDNYTVKLTPIQDSSDVMLVLAGQFQFAAIYPESVASSNSGDKAITEHIGTGPYKMKEWKQDQYIQLEKYEDYVSPTGPVSGFTGAKTPTTQIIEFDVVTDAQTRLNGLRSGEYDVAEDLLAEDYSSIKDESGIDVHTKPSGSLNLFLNCSPSGKLSNVKLRQAILAALNCDDIMLSAYGDKDLYQMSCSWMNPTDTSWAVENGKEYYNQNDSSKAKQLAEEAGYNGESLTFVATQDYPEMYAGTLAIQDQLTKAGFKVDVVNYDFSTFMQKRADAATFDLFVTQNVYNISPVQLNLINKSWNQFEDSKVNELTTEIRDVNTFDPKKPWGELQEYLYEQGSATVLGHNQRVMATSEKLEDFTFFTFPVYWNCKIAS